MAPKDEFAVRIHGKHNRKGGLRRIISYQEGVTDFIKTLGRLPNTARDKNLG